MSTNGSTSGVWGKNRDPSGKEGQEIVFQPKEWKDIHLLPWSSPEYGLGDVERLISSLPEEFQAAMRRSFQDISKTYSKIGERRLSVLVGHEIERKTGGRHTAVQTLMSYIIADKLLSIPSLHVSGPSFPVRVERTRYNVQDTPLPGLEELSDWPKLLAERAVEFEELSRTENVKSSCQVGTFTRLLASMDTRQRKIRSQVALLNMEAAAFYLYALSQGFSDVPSDLKVLKMLVERQADVDQPLPKSYSPKKIRGPLHAAMAISPLMLLTGENLQTRPATHAVLMKTWYHLGNQRPLQLRMVEQALWRELIEIAIHGKTAEQGLMHFFAAFRNVRPIEGWSKESRLFFRRDTGTRLRELTPFPNYEEPTTLLEVEGAFIQSIADNIDDEEDGKSQEDEDIGTEADAGNGETQLSDANVVESDQVGNPSQCDADNDRIESNEQKIRENDLEVRDDETSREECSVPDVQADHSRESSPSGAETEDDSGESEVSQGDVPSGMDDDMHVDDENPKTIDENEEEGESELGGDGDGRRSVEDHLDSEEQPEEDISKKGNKKKKKTKEDSDRDDTAQEDQDENHEGTDDSAEGQEEKEDEVTLPPLADHTDRQVYTGPTYVIPSVSGHGNVVYTPRRYDPQDLEDFENLITAGASQCHQLSRPFKGTAAAASQSDAKTLLEEQFAPFIHVLVMQHASVGNITPSTLQSIFASRPLVIVNASHHLDQRSVSEIAESLGNLFSYRTVHDLTLVGVSEDADFVHRKGRLIDVVRELQRKDPRPLNVLALPGSGKGDWVRWGLSTDDVAYRHCIGMRGGRNIPRNLFPEELSWHLLATGDAFHTAHVDACGFATVITVDKGSKIIFILTPEDSTDWSVAASLEFFRGLCLNGSNSVGWKITPILLQPGDSIVMPPMTVHYVVSPEPAICHGGHFYSMSTLRRTCWALLHMVHRSESFTNTSHPCHRRMLATIMDYWWDVIVNESDWYVAKCLSGENITNFPNLFTFSGIMDFVYLFAILRFGSALWEERYRRPVQIPKIDIQAFAVAQQHAKEVLAWMGELSWSVYLVCKEGVRPDIRVPLKDIVHSVLAQQACTLLQQSRECKMPCYREVKNALKKEMGRDTGGLWATIEEADTATTVFSIGVFQHRPEHNESYQWAQESPKEGYHYAVLDVHENPVEPGSYDEESSGANKDARTHLHDESNIQDVSPTLGGRQHLKRKRNIKDDGTAIRKVHRLQ